MRTLFGRLNIPRAPVAGAIALLLVTLAVTDFGGLVGDAGATSRPGPPVASYALLFEDRADGAVVVRNAESGAEVQVLDAGSNAFLRGTLRALTRERRKDQIGRETPFRLSAWSDGRMLLEDPATGQRVPLEAFGDTNKEVFVGILAAAGARR